MTSTSLATIMAIHGSTSALGPTHPGAGTIQQVITVSNHPSTTNHSRPHVQNLLHLLGTLDRQEGLEQDTDTERPQST